MAKQWIVVATRTGARVFSARQFSLVAEMNNDLGREKNRAFTTAKPVSGRNRTASRASTHRMTGEKTPHDDVAKAFAKDIKSYLTMQMNLHRFDEVLIAAEPRMMGWLKGQMSEKLKARVDWLPKDLGRLSTHEVKRFLSEGGYGWPAKLTSRSSS